MLLHLGKFKQIINHALHLLGFFISNVVVLQNVLLTAVLLIFNQAQVADNAGQRRAQVMADVGDQLIFGLFHLPLIIH